MIHGDAMQRKNCVCGWKISRSVIAKNLSQPGRYHRSSVYIPMDYVCY